jgi:hypothetical protein
MRGIIPPITRKSPWRGAWCSESLVLPQIYRNGGRSNLCLYLVPLSMLYVPQTDSP